MNLVKRKRQSTIFNRGGPFSALCIGALLLNLIGMQNVAAEDEVIEEVLVTGSFLKRTAQDSPSPLSVITSADIDDLGAADIAEVVQSLPWQSGSQTRASTFQGEGADGRSSINFVTWDMVQPCH